MHGEREGVWGGTTRSGVGSHEACVATQGGGRGRGGGGKGEGKGDGDHGCVVVVVVVVGAAAVVVVLGGDCFWHLQPLFASLQIASLFT